MRRWKPQSLILRRNNMRLLIKRDRNHLVKVNGKAELDSDVPSELNEVRVVPQSIVKTNEDRNQQDDLLISNKEDYNDIDKHFLRADGTPINALPGIWSGYRSVLVRDNQSDKLFRLKGVSLDINNPLIQDVSDEEYIVFGGQPRFSAEYEKQMSDKFNKVLKKEGIAPVMECKGYWHYPKKIKKIPYSASVVQVEGDTRLDEIMLILEQFFSHRINGNNKPKDRDGVVRISVNKDGEYVGNKISQLYQDIGFVVGRLKRLMDKNNQTWSADGERSNAHIGNIVLYNVSSDVKTNFVDFDASCDTEDFSKSKIRDMQKREYQTIINSAYAPSISLRRIQARFLTNQDKGIFKELRDAFVQGFSAGYDKKIGLFSPAITNTIPFERFLEIFEILRSGRKLTPEVERYYNELEKRIKDFDPYGILNKNKKYQEDLFDGYIKKSKDLLDVSYSKDNYNFYGSKNYLDDSILYKNRRKNLDDYLC